MDFRVTHRCFQLTIAASNSQSDPRQIGSMRSGLRNSVCAGVHVLVSISNIYALLRSWAIWNTATEWELMVVVYS